MIRDLFTNYEWWRVIEGESTHLSMQIRLRYHFICRETIRKGHGAIQILVQFKSN